MRGLILAGALAALLAAPAQAEDPQRVCSGHAAGANGEAVNVMIYLTAKGDRVGSFASWDPPRIGPPAPTAEAVPDVYFSMMYHQAGPSGLGPAGDPAIGATAFAPPGKRGRGNAERQFAGLSVELTVDSSAPQMLPLTVNALFAPLPMTAMREAKAPALPANAGTVTLRLVRSGKPPLSTARYDLSGTAERDRLFTAAWQNAETAARTPETCEETVAP
ncbi:MAG TPA: hypothetical protein VFV30_11080 [Novosphingobium sp.]|nr:hypothetical protein [Novosphingobium sp.]